MTSRQASTPRIAAVMRAIRLHSSGGAAGLVREQLQTPPLADAREAFERSLGAHRPGKIVLRVAAA